MTDEQRADAEVRLQAGVWIVDEDTGHLRNVSRYHAKAELEEQYRASLHAQGYEWAEIDAIQDKIRRQRKRRGNRGVSAFQTKELSDLGYLRGR